MVREIAQQWKMVQKQCNQVNLESESETNLVEEYNFGENI